MSNSKDPVTARLDIEVFVDCPHCGFLIDLMSSDDTNGKDLNEEGFILDQACPDGYGCWSDKHQKFEVKDVTCSSCNKQFSVKGMEW